MPITQIQTGKTPASRFEPRTLLLYARQKQGKTTALSMLKDCGILDIKGGVETEFVDAIKYPLCNIGEFRDQLQVFKVGGKPHRFLALDTLSDLEQWAEQSATVKYKQSILGKSFVGTSVLELPQGMGFGLLRNEVQAMIIACAEMVPQHGALILICHLRDKFLDGQIVRDAGKETGKKDTTATASYEVDLTGKLRAMVTGMVDSTAFVYRTTASHLRASFLTSDESSCGTRCKWLEGTTVDLVTYDKEKDSLTSHWDNIFSNVPKETVKIDRSRHL